MKSGTKDTVSEIERALVIEYGTTKASKNASNKGERPNLQATTKSRPTNANLASSVSRPTMIVARRIRRLRRLLLNRSQALLIMPEREFDWGTGEGLSTLSLRAKNETNARAQTEGARQIACSQNYE